VVIQLGSAQLATLADALTSLFARMDDPPRGHLHVPRASGSRLRRHHEQARGARRQRQREAAAVVRHRLAVPEVGYALDQPVRPFVQIDRADLLAIVPIERTNQRRCGQRDDAEPEVSVRKNRRNAGRGSNFRNIATRAAGIRVRSSADRIIPPVA